MKKKIMYPCKHCGAELKVRTYGLYCSDCVSTSSIKIGMSIADSIYEATGKVAKYILVPDGMDVGRVNLTIMFANAIAERLSQAGEKFSNKNIFDPAIFNADYCREKLLECMAEGNPIDVAIYSAFLWNNDQNTVKFEFKSEKEVWLNYDAKPTVSQHMIPIQEFLENFAQGIFTHDGVNGKMFWFDSGECKFRQEPINLSKTVPINATHVIVSF
jgi:hypothetical protein